MRFTKLRDQQVALTSERDAILADLEKLAFALRLYRRRSDPHSRYLFTELKVLLDNFKNAEGGFEPTIDFWGLPAGERRKLQEGPPTKL